MDEYTQDGRRLSAALDRALNGIEPDLAPLVARAAVQGRSLRRRRTAGTFGTVAVVATLAVGGVLLTQAGGGGPAPPQALAASSGAAAHLGKVPLTGKTTVRALLDLLPQGLTARDFAGDESRWDGEPDRPADAYGQATVDDGHGAVLVSLELAQGSPSYVNGTGSPATASEPGGTVPVDPAKVRSFLARYDCATRDAGHHDACTASTLPGGGRLILVQDSRSGLIERTADLLRADGSLVRAVTHSYTVATASEPGGVVRDTPPLSLEQLKAIVTGETLQLWAGSDLADRADRTVTPYTADTTGPSALPLGPARSGSGPDVQK